MHKSPVHDFHIKHGGHMVDYAGWELPIRFRSIRDEHEQTRKSGSVFDVSHMGRIEIKGLHARRLLERACSRRIGNMQAGQCRYTLICNERGGVRDDAVVMRLDDDEFLMVCNGANREKIGDHLASIAGERPEWKVKLEDKTLKTAMVAIQGPKVMELVSAVSKEIPTLKRWRFTVKNLMIIKLIVSRTGYTGEDGVEVILPASAVGMAMRLLILDVDPDDPNAVLKPAGLASRGHAPPRGGHAALRARARRGHQRPRVQARLRDQPRQDRGRRRHVRRAGGARPRNATPAVRPSGSSGSSSIPNAPPARACPSARQRNRSGTSAADCA
ncbi:MAG: hypothetical protein R3B49_02750 [Phycisphaerales bacterium]